MAPRSTSAPIQSVYPDTARDGENDNAAREEDLQQRMHAFVARMSDEANRRVLRRNAIETRWIEDLQQYHGIYDAKLRQRLEENQGSRVFVNLTATKTDAMEARLWDLLFPTDDRNWGIGPTPVPEMTEGAEEALKQVDQARKRGDTAEQQATMLAEQGDMQGAQAAEREMRAAEEEENAAQAAADALQERVREAQRRARLMQEEIDDQLVTCGYPSEARDAISDACKLGIGILKGPVIGDRPKRRWRQVDGGEPGPDGQPSAAVYALEVVEDDTPAAYRVDPWAFFPDPDARRIRDSEGVYERHMMNKAQVRKLALRPDIDKDALRALLKAGPESGSTPTYMADLRDLTGQSDGGSRDVYAVWEYTGPIETEEMELLIEAFEEDEAGDREEIDPLEENHVRLWFCQGRILSFAPHPLDSNDPLYSCFTIRPDESSMFGFGIPYIMRHPQAVLNGAYRMMMDNSGLSTGPQIVVNKDVVTPEDGSWILTPRKVWKRNSSQTAPGVPAFEIFNIASNQQELASIIEIASATIDEVTAMPAIAQGEQGTGVTKTAQGMALLMNSANVNFRRVVKNFDDEMTVPVITRFYHWNMQFSPKDEIKGDYEVKARGSGVLLVREMQAQNLLMIANMFGDHPVYGPRLKHGDLLRQIFRAHMIPADEITRTEREYEQFLAEQEQQQDPAAAAEAAKAAAMEAEVEMRGRELEAKIAMHEKEWDHRLQIARLTYDASMEKIASALNMKREELEERMSEFSAKADSDERRLAAEIAMRGRTGVSSGGAV